jgi:hypothetical protein
MVERGNKAPHDRALAFWVRQQVRNGPERAGSPKHLSPAPKPHKLDQLWHAGIRNVNAIEMQPKVDHLIEADQFRVRTT